MTPHLAKIFVLLALVASGLGLIFSTQIKVVQEKDRHNDSLIATKYASDRDTKLQSSNVSNSAVIQAEVASFDPLRLSEHATEPVEIVNSIYDFDLDYSQKAIKVAAETIRHYAPESIVRWRPIHVDISSFLHGEYTDVHAVQETLSISPFPDVRIVADKLTYQVTANVRGSIWTGKIRNSDAGVVRITYVDSQPAPGLVIRILNSPYSYDIFQTDIRDVYLALEGNPNTNFSD